MDSDNEWFLELVAERRGLSKDQMNAVRDAQVYSARDALALGLVDGIASRDDLVLALRKEVGDLPLKDMSIDEEDVLGLSKFFRTQRRSVSNVLRSIWNARFS